MEEILIYLQPISIIIASISAIIASIIAIRGINAWRREFVGKRKIELIEDVLELFYRAKRVIRHMRSGTKKPNEGSTRKSDSDESIETKELRDAAYVLIERYQQQIKLFSELDAKEIKFRMYFDDDACKSFFELNVLIHKLIFSARKLQELWPKIRNSEHRSESDRAKLLSQTNKMEKISI